MSLPLSELADGYMAAIRYEQGCTRQTCYTYRSWLNTFLKWLDANGHPDDLASLSPGTLRTYVYSLSQRGLRPRTVRSAYLPVKGLCAHLLKHGILAESPTVGIALPKKDAAQRAAVSHDEVVALLGGAARLYPAGDRSLARAMICTLALSGVRFSEWLNLRVGDVDLTTGTVLVRSGKGQKPRTLYPPAECMDAVRDWQVERGKLGCRHDWLWAADRARRMGVVGSRALLERVKAAAGIDDHANVKPHALRHAFASRMLTNGANLKVIQAALGHTDIKTTAMYLHIDEREAAKMAQYAAVAMPQAVPVVKAQSPVTKPTAADFHRHRRASVRDRQG